MGDAQGFILGLRKIYFLSHLHDSPPSVVFMSLEFRVLSLEAVVSVELKV